MTTIFVKTSALPTAHVVSAAIRPASANVIPKTQLHAVQLHMEHAVGSESSIMCFKFLLLCCGLHYQTRGWNSKYQINIPVASL
jgi:hypothetical protein